jgi:hypothetical protein
MTRDKISKFASYSPLVGVAHAKSLSEYTNIFSVICKPDGDKANNLESVTCTVTNAINLIFDIAGIIAFIMILYSSIIYLTSYGEESRIEMAKKTLIWSVVGVIVILLAKSVLIIITKSISNPTAPIS